MESQERIGDVNPYESPRVVDEVVTTSTIGTSAIDLSTENPFLTIWTRPRATIRGIVNTDPRRYVVPLATAGGVVHALESAIGQNFGNSLQLTVFVLLAVVIGPIGGLIGLHVLGCILGATGCRLGGSGTWEECRAAVAWSTVPGLAGAPILVIELALFRHELFIRTAQERAFNPAFDMLLVTCVLLQFVLAIWAFVLLFNCIGEVHRISAVAAFGSLVLAGLYSLAAIAVILVLAALVIFVH